MLTADDCWHYTLYNGKIAGKVSVLKMLVVNDVYKMDKQWLEVRCCC